MAAGISTGLTAGTFTSSEGRRFGFTVGAACAMLAALWWWRGHPRGAVVAVSIGALLILGAAVIPTKLRPLYRGWMRLADLLSAVTTPMFMAVVYFLVLTPIGWLRRTLIGHPFATARDADSVWVARDGTARRSDLERQF